MCWNGLLQHNCAAGNDSCISSVALCHPKYVCNEAYSYLMVNISYMLIVHSVVGGWLITSHIYVCEIGLLGEHNLYTHVLWKLPTHMHTHAVGDHDQYTHVLWKLPAYTHAAGDHNQYCEIHTCTVGNHNQYTHVMYQCKHTLMLQKTSTPSYCDW